MPTKKRVPIRSADVLLFILQMLKMRLVGLPAITDSGTLIAVAIYAIGFITLVLSERKKGRWRSKWSGMKIAIEIACTAILAIPLLLQAPPVAISVTGILVVGIPAAMYGCLLVYPALAYENVEIAEEERVFSIPRWLNILLSTFCWLCAFTSMPRTFHYTLQPAIVSVVVFVQITILVFAVVAFTALFLHSLLRRNA